MPFRTCSMPNTLTSGEAHTLWGILNIGAGCRCRKNQAEKEGNRMHRVCESTARKGIREKDRKKNRKNSNKRMTEAHRSQDQLLDIKLEGTLAGGRERQICLVQQTRAHPVQQYSRGYLYGAQAFGESSSPCWRRRGILGLRVPKAGETAS